MTKDNTNSQGLMLRVYPTIKHTITKTWSSYFLGLSLGLSLLAMGDAWALEMIWCCNGSWCSCVIHFILTGTRGLTAGHILPYMTWCSQFEKCFRDTASSMVLLPFHNSPFSFIICYLFIIVLLKWFRLLFCRLLWGGDGSLWTLESGLLVTSLWLEALTALVKALACLLFLLFLFLFVLDVVTCAGQ